jgi:RNA polymerase sigma-70 factor (ECF subfamily)
MTIVRNTSYTWLAKNRPATLVLSGDLDETERERVEESEDPHLAATPEAALIAKMDAEAVNKAVASLPAPFREVLVLREIHDFDYRTIAEIAQIPIGTVMSRLARARRLLIAAIQERLP